MLAVAKSHRAVAERELVGFGPAYEGAGLAGEQVHTVISATIDRSGEPVKVQVDLLGPPIGRVTESPAPEGTGVESNSGGY